MAKYTVDQGGITLDQLDKIRALTAEGEVGNMVATCYVVLSESHGLTLDDCKALRMRDVDMLDDDVDTEDAGAADPTPAS